MRQPTDWKKYVFTFAITVIIFGSALYVNSLIDQRKYQEIRLIQDQIALDLLSSESQFDLLKQTSCKNINDSILSTELNSLATKLSYLEANKSANDAELLLVKKNYSLLEIKDYLLMKELNQKCKSKPIAILYFYDKKEDCPDCEKMGYVLTYLRQQYPELRIYSFDFNLKLSAIDTIKSIYKLDQNLPAIVYNDDAYYGFKSIEEMKDLIPELKKIDTERIASSTASKASTTKNPTPLINTKSSTTSR